MGAAQTITHALYHLAEKPEFIPQLRAEIETCIAADGWTGTALGNMWKLDSLLRETLRYHGVTLRKYYAHPMFTPRWYKSIQLTSSCAASRTGTGSQCR